MSFPQALCRLGHPNLCRGCFRSSLETAAPQLRETVWLPLGMSAGTWPQGRLRCCAENGANQAWLGMAVLAMRHLVSTCEGTALGVGWDGERTWESWDSQSPQLPLDLHFSVWESGCAGRRGFGGQLFHRSGLTKSAICRWHEHA